MSTFPTILLALALVAFLAIVVTSRSTRSKDPGRRSTPPASVTEVLQRPLPPETRNRALELISRDRKIQAIKELREATGYGLREAKEVVDALATGGGPPSTSDTRPDSSRSASASAPQLAERARQLKAGGDETRAIRLVCDETGMTILEAQQFVRSLAS